MQGPERGRMILRVFPRSCFKKIFESLENVLTAGKVESKYSYNARHPSVYVCAMQVQNHFKDRSGTSFAAMATGKVYGTSAAPCSFENVPFTKGFSAASKNNIKRQADQRENQQPIWRHEHDIGAH